MRNSIGKIILIVQRYWNTAKQAVIGLISGGFFYIFFGNILSKAISMVSSIVVARIISKAEYAYLSYADNLYSYITLIAGFGLSSATLKFCATAESREKEYSFFHFALSRGVCIQLFSALALCIATAVLPIPFPAARRYMWLLCLYPALHFFQEINCYSLRVHLENKLYSLMGLLQAVFLCILCILLVYFYDTLGMVAARYIALVVVLLLSFSIISRRYYSGLSIKPLCREEARNMLSMGLSLMIASVFSGIMPINESFLVNNLIKDEVITANFRIAGLFPAQLLLIPGAIVVYYFPIVAKMTDPQKILKKVYQVGFITAGISIFVTIICLFITPFAIRFLYGDKYVDAIPMTYLLWLMRCTNASIRMIPMNMLAAIGKTKFNAFCAPLTCLVQTALDYYFIRFTGITGLAYGTFFAYIISGVAYWVYFRRCCIQQMNNREEK